MDSGEYFCTTGGILVLFVPWGCSSKSISVQLWGTTGSFLKLSKNTRWEPFCCMIMKHQCACCPFSTPWHYLWHSTLQHRDLGPLKAAPLGVSVWCLSVSVLLMLQGSWELALSSWQWRAEIPPVLLSLGWHYHSVIMGKKLSNSDMWYVPIIF